MVTLSLSHMTQDNAFARGVCGWYLGREEVGMMGEGLGSMVCILHMAKTAASCKLIPFPSSLSLPLSLNRRGNGVLL